MSNEQNEHTLALAAQIAEFLGEDRAQIQTNVATARLGEALCICMPSYLAERLLRLAQEKH